MKLLLPFLILVLYPNSGLATFECTAGTWGAHCRQACGKCEGGDEFCQVYDGMCVNGCGSGYKGEHCKEPCEPGFYGQNCKSVCGNCSRVQITCSPETGKCLAGCRPGYQEPYCKIPCPFNTSGKKCATKCKCNKNCGCHHETGECLPCGSDGQPVSIVDKVERQECINQHALDESIPEYIPPNVLDIPWMPILYAVGVVLLFVLTNFLWWYFMVRKPSPKKEPVEIKRGSLPKARRKKKKGFQEALKEAKAAIKKAQEDNDVK